MVMLLVLKWQWIRNLKTILLKNGEGRSMSWANVIYINIIKLSLSLKTTWYNLIHQLVKYFVSLDWITLDCQLSQVDTGILPGN